jgi:hypothetical protein
MNSLARDIFLFLGCASSNRGTVSGTLSYVRRGAVVLAWCIFSLGIFNLFGVTIGTTLYVAYFIYVILFTFFQDRKIRRLSKFSFAPDVRTRLYRDGADYVYYDPFLVPELKKYRAEISMGVVVNVFLLFLVLVIVSTGF